jgi:hypothetical protein
MSSRFVAFGKHVIDMSKVHRITRCTNPFEKKDGFLLLFDKPCDPPSYYIYSGVDPEAFQAMNSWIQNLNIKATNTTANFDTDSDTKW